MLHPNAMFSGHLFTQLKVISNHRLNGIFGWILTNTKYLDRAKASKYIQVLTEWASKCFFNGTLDHAGIKR